MTTTTQLGVDDSASSFLTEDDAADQFLSRWSEKDPENTSASKRPEDEDANRETDEPTEREAEEEHVETDESQEDLENGSEQENENEGEAESTETKPKGKVLDDDAVVSMTVDGTELQVSVKDLKRLHGQEAALTKKSQHVADQRKEVERANQVAAATLDRLSQKAQARWEPYSKIDMLVASKTLDAEQFTALRAEAQAAFDEHRFITQEVDSFVKESNSQREKAIKVAAAEAVKTLTEKIPGWNQQVYDDVRAYAETAGMQKHVVDNIVDATALEMLHKAMQFDKAKSIVTTRVNKTPTKVLKTNATIPSKQTVTDKALKAKQRLQSSGSTDDAAELFLSRWSK